MLKPKQDWSSCLLFFTPVFDIWWMLFIQRRDRLRLWSWGSLQWDRDNECFCPGLSNTKQQRLDTFFCQALSCIHFKKTPATKSTPEWPACINGETSCQKLTCTAVLLCVLQGAQICKTILANTCRRDLRYKEKILQHKRVESLRSLLFVSYGSAALAWVCEIPNLLTKLFRKER